MKITMKVLGIPGLASGERELDMDGSTLGGAADHLAREDAKFSSMRDGLLWFVNGKAVGRGWKEFSLSEGDSVMRAIPIAGG